MAPADTAPSTALSRLLRPTSVALVGATDRSNWSVNALANLRRYSPEVRVELVHPHRSEVLGRPAVSALRELAGPIDLAYVMAPREYVPGIIREAGELGVGGIVVLTAGFGETADGRVHHRELVAAATETGLPVLGPNGSGFVDVARSIVPFGLALPALPDPGAAAFVLQSGGLIKPLLAQARAWGIGVDAVIGTGNEAVLSSVAVADHLLEHGAGAIGLFLEGFRDPAGFRALAAKAARLDRPLVVLPVGRSEAARSAAQSHTGALVADAGATGAVLRSLGVVEVDTMEDLIFTTGLLAAGFRPRGNRIAVVGASGGAGELIADAAEADDLTLPPFDPALEEALTGLLPAFSHVANPLDVTGYATVDPTLPVRAVETIADRHGADVLLFQAFVTPPEDPADPVATRDHFSAIARAFSGQSVPVLLADEVPLGLGDFARSLFAELGLVRLPGVAIGLRAVGHAVRYVRGRPAAAGRDPAPSPASDGAAAVGRWSEPEALDRLARLGVPVIPHAVTGSPQEAVAAAESFGGPVVLKIVSADIGHKTEVGGVLVGLSGEAVAQGWRTMTAQVAARCPEARIDGVMVAPLRSGGVELIAGVHRDPTWGPILMIGSGGVLTEVIKDVVLRPLPVSEADIRQMLGELKGSALLAGVRGRPGGDPAAVAGAVLALTRITRAWRPDWASVEINPLWVHGTTVEAWDALVIPQPVEETTSAPISGAGGSE